MSKNNTNIDMDMMKSMFQQFLQTEEGQKMVQQQQQNKQVANISSTTGETYASKVNSLMGNIVIADYLKDYLSDLEKPEKITYEFLIQVGKEALSEKVAYIEEFNMGLQSGRRKVPTKLDFDDVAVIMMTLFTFKNIQMTDDSKDILLGMYDDRKGSRTEGVYVENKNKIYSIMGRIAPSFKKKDMDDVLDAIQRNVEIVRPTEDKHLFAVKNGVFNNKTKELLPFSPDMVFLTKIPVDYVDNPVSPVFTASDGYKWDVDSWFDDIFDGDKQTIKLIWQVIADSLQPNYSRGKSIWFYSEKGNNGKGTVGQLIKNLLGRGNYASLSVADFKERFAKEPLIHVAANIADENDVNIYIDSVKDYKATITGDDFTVDRKYEKPVSIKFRGTNIQMMNGLPKTKDKTDSFYRRIIIVPFMKSFTDNGERKYIKDVYINDPKVLEYVLHKALHLEHFDEFIVPNKSIELLADYKEMNDPVLEFWNELKDEFVWDLLPTKFLYDLFKKWAEMYNPSVMKKNYNTFSREIRNVIESQGEWMLANVSSKGRMDDDEPLITKFGLDRLDKDGYYSEWVKEGSHGATPPKEKRNFKRADRYRGYVRL